MKHLTENITYIVDNYGYYKVTDNWNKVSVTVPSYIIDEVDTDDPESVEKCLASLRDRFKRKDIPHFNIVVTVNSKRGEAYWDGEDYQCDPLCYKDAWNAEDTLANLKLAREKFCDAYTEEVEPFLS